MAPSRSALKPVETINLWPDAEKYSDGKGADPYTPVMDIYTLPDDGKIRPAMVIYPGGGYSHLADHEGVDIAEKFNQLGFNAFVVKYRLAPHRYPAQQQDAFRGIKLVRANAAKWHVNPNQIATCGFSAGGHLCASTGTMFDKVDASAGDEADKESQRPDALVLCYPVISFSREFGHRGSGVSLLGDKLEELEESFSCEKLVTENTPPAYMWHTAQDNAVPVENSLRFAKAMQSFGNKWGLHVFPCGGHGLGLAPDCPEIKVWPELARDFLKYNCGFDC